MPEFLMVRGLQRARSPEPTVRRASAKPARSACRRRSPTRFTMRSACASRNCRSPPRRSTARYAGRRNDERRASDDLVGHVLCQEEWEILSFPAIAEKDEEHRIEMILEPRCFGCRHGEALHPDREPLEVLDRIRRMIGEYNFAGQYQQSPAPLGGGWSRPTGSDATAGTSSRSASTAFAELGHRQQSDRAQRFLGADNLGRYATSRFLPRLRRPKSLDAIALSHYTGSACRAEETASFCERPGLTQLRIGAGDPLDQPHRLGHRRDRAAVSGRRRASNGN